MTLSIGLILRGRRFRCGTPRRSSCCATATAGLEAWLLTRVTRMAFAGGMAVFPGGRVDDADAELPFAGGADARGARASGATKEQARALSAPRCARRSRRPACCSPCRPPTCPVRAPTSRPGGCRSASCCARTSSPSTRPRCSLVALDHPARRGAPLRHALLRRRAARRRGGAGRHDRVVVGGLGRRRCGARAGAARRAGMLPPTIVTLAVARAASTRWPRCWRRRAALGPRPDRARSITSRRRRTAASPSCPTATTIQRMPERRMFRGR